MPRPALHDRLTWRLSRVARIMQSQLESRLAQEGLTRMTWLVLTGLGEDGIATPSDLAAHIGITRPATSRLLARMEASGHVTRRLAGHDARSVTLTLTDLGHAVLDRTRPDVYAHLARYRAKLDPAAYASLMDALARLAEGEDDRLSTL